MSGFSDEFKLWFLSPISSNEYEKKLKKDEVMRESNRKLKRKNYGNKTN